MYKYFFLLSALILCLTGCQTTSENIDQTVVQSEKDGIEMVMKVDKNTYEEDEKVFVDMTIANRNPTDQSITIFTDERSEGFVHAYHIEEKWYGHFRPTNEIQGEKGEGFSNSLAFALAPGETFERRFEWDQTVDDFIMGFHYDESREPLPAPSGKYEIFALIFVGDMTFMREENIDPEMMERFDDEMMARQLRIALPIELKGDRTLLTLAQAEALVVAHPKAGEWYRSRTYEELVKRKRGAWYLTDVDGTQTKITKENAAQLKDAKPRFAGGERKEDTLTLEYESALGGEPYRMSVEIDTKTKRIASVTFPQ